MKRRFELQRRILNNEYLRDWRVAADSYHSASKAIANYKSSKRDKNVIEREKADGAEFRLVTIEIVETPIACEEL